MSRAWKAALGFGLGTALGVLLTLGLSLMMETTSGIKEGSAAVGAMNMVSFGAGGFLAGAIGGASLGRGWLAVLGYGLVFIPLLFISAVSLLTFM